MFRNLKITIEIKNIPKRIQTYINKTLNIEKLTLEELKQFLSEVTEFEQFLINNKDKIKDEMKMDCVKLISNLRSKLSQLCEDKEIIADYLKEDKTYDNFMDLPDKEKNFIFSNEIIKNDIQKEIQSIKELYEKYNQLCTNKKESKYSYKNFILKLKKVGIPKWHITLPTFKLNLIQKIPFLRKNEKKINNFYVNTRGEIEALLFKLYHSSRIICEDIKNYAKSKGLNIQNRYNEMCIKAQKFKENVINSVKTKLINTLNVFSKIKKKLLKKRRGNQKKLILKTALFTLMFSLGICGLSSGKSTSNVFQKSNRKIIKFEINQDEINNIEVLKYNLKKDSPVQKTQIVNSEKNEMLEPIKTETSLPEEEIQLTDIELELPEEMNENIFSIGKEITIDSESILYSNMYDVYFNKNQLTPYYSAESIPRTINSIIVSNGEEIKNIKTNEELSTYIDNNYEIIGCGVTNQYSENNTIEGFYRIESIKDYNSKSIQKNLYSQSKIYQI